MLQFSAIYQCSIMKTIGCLCLNHTQIVLTHHGTHTHTTWTSGQHNEAKLLNEVFHIDSTILRDLFSGILNYTPKDIELKVPFKRRCILYKFPMRLKKRLGPIVYFLTTPMMPRLGRSFRNEGSCLSGIAILDKSSRKNPN